MSLTLALALAVLPVGAQPSALASAGRTTLTVCSPPDGADEGPVVSISYGTAPASLTALNVQTRRGPRAVHREVAVRRLGSGRSGPKPAVVFQGEGFELVVNTAKPGLAAYPARLRVLSVFGVRAATFGCRRFELDADEPLCPQENGQWSPRPPVCVWPSTDGGKPCTESNQCETACVAPKDAVEGKKTKGRCYERTSLIGSCVAMVVNGVAGRTACVD